MKKFISLIIAFAMALSCGLAVGCGGGGNNTDGSVTLDIYALNKGYGVTWLEQIKDEFLKEDFVKQKYPNLKIELTTDSVSSEVGSKMTSGSIGNKYDLLFTTNPSNAYFNHKGSDGTYDFEDLTSVYESEVPGESVKVKDKMHAEIYAQQKVENLDGSYSYYGMPWVDGYMGLLYNATFIETNLGADYVMPRTTDELKKTAADILAANVTVEGSKDTKVKAFIFDKLDGNYFTQIYNTWWAQYSGISEYESFWNGQISQDDGDEVIKVRSNKIFDYENTDDVSHGRLRALEVLNELIGYNGDQASQYVRTDSTWSFAKAQGRFINGEGVIMPNGDWFYNENYSIQVNAKGTIKFMKMPVISSIIEKCDSVTTDAQLAFVVSCVDDGEEYSAAASKFSQEFSATLSQADFDRIEEARTVMFRLHGHEAYIPSYASEKEIAKDFLRYLATDKAINTFMRATYGCQTAFKYDVQQKDAALYSSFSAVSKSRADMALTGVRLRPISTFRLSSYGGLQNFCTSNISNPATAFTAQNVKDRMTPTEMVEKDRAYYNADNQAAWKSLLNKAGY